jgi:CBS-domain-containing membrane protein
LSRKAVQAAGWARKRVVEEAMMRRVKVKDVMSSTVVAAAEQTGYKELVQLMSESRVSGVPVIDRDGRLVGIVTEADLLLAEEGEQTSLLHMRLAHPKRLAALAREAKGVRASDIMTRQVITACPDDTVHEAAKKLLEAKVKRLPVVDDDTRVVGIVSRSDLLQPYLRTDEEIRAEITEDVILRTMSIDPKTIRVEVSDGLVHLHGRVDSRSEKDLVLEFVRRVDGVVGVDDHLTFAANDRNSPPVGISPPLGWSENWVRRS